MINTLLIVSTLAILFSLIALIVSVVSLAFVIGLKNSTHQVVWKPVDEPKDDDPFDFNNNLYPEDEELVNPNKRIKKEVKEDEEDLVDLTDPTVTSGF